VRKVPDEWVGAAAETSRGTILGQISSCQISRVGRLRSRLGREEGQYGVTAIRGETKKRGECSRRRTGRRRGVKGMVDGPMQSAFQCVVDGGLRESGSSGAEGEGAYAIQGFGAGRFSW